jgi:hypothetical protein
MLKVGLGNVSSLKGIGDAYQTAGLVENGDRNIVRSGGIKSHARHLLQVPEVTCIEPSINIFGYRIFIYLKIKKNNPLNLRFSIRWFYLGRHFLYYVLQSFLFISVSSESGFEPPVLH